MSRPIITLKIDVTKIAKQYLFQGKKGTYLDVALFERPDDYGGAGFITQDVGKTARESGVRCEIIGNWKWAEDQKPKTAPKLPQPQQPQRPAQRPKPPADPDLDAQPDDIPF